MFFLFVLKKHADSDNIFTKINKGNLVMYKKIAIIGAPGTGKTTLANKLSKMLQIPATHIDGIHHLPNWEIRNKDERDNLILEIASKDTWIIDGTYKSTLRKRLELADLIIWLDFSTLAQIKGIISRYLKNRNQEKPEIPGCREKLDLQFFIYVLKYNKVKRINIVNNIEGINENKIIILKTRKQVNRWLANFERSING